jgi:hypothetical protein
LACGFSVFAFSISGFFGGSAALFAEKLCFSEQRAKYSRGSAAANQAAFYRSRNRNGYDRGFWLWFSILKFQI